MFVLLVAAVVLAASGALTAEEASPVRVLVVAGPSTHPPGTHEAMAGARLMASCLESATNVPAVEAIVVYDWPKDPAELKGLSTIVFIGDRFPPERMENPEAIKADLSKLMDGGCGMVCVHYATGLQAQHVAEDGDHPLLRWIGGYFATGCKHHKSVARVCPATLTPADGEHPVLCGWKEFYLDDEPYWNNYFGPNGPAKNVTSLVTAMLPADAPKQETLVWAVDRPDGGRGVGAVVPHYFHNWRHDDLRKMIMNAIYWTAKVEIPAEGVVTPVPDLAAFEPVSVEPAPRR
jgi:type 1 glutamine amidotransferase